MALSKNILSTPYYLNGSPLVQFKMALFFGAFVFLFLFVFQPFQIRSLGEGYLLATAVFGAITFSTMVFLNIFLPLFFRKFFDERRWTVGKELFQSLLNISLIGLFNFLFFNYLTNNRLSLESLLWFQFNTVAIGIFPVAFITIFRERKNRFKYISEADTLSGTLKETPLTGQMGIVTIPSQNKNESLQIALEQICFFQSADNYVEVYFFDGALQKRMLRNTLKVLEKELAVHSVLFRCHNSYMVNLDKVIKISGNAQGYKLHLGEVNHVIPVSRQYNPQIKEHLSNRP